MKAFAVDGPGAQVTEIEREDPVPVGREVFLKIRYSGVCHSDTHLRSGGYDIGTRGYLSMASRGMEYPAVFGHEIVGEVAAVGPEVTDVQPGDLRLVFPWIGCDDCARCAAGRENDCRKSQALGVYRWGGFASHVMVPDEKYLIDIEGLDPAWAATLACSGVTSYAAVRSLPALDDDEWVAVIGAGGVGLAGIALLRELVSAKVAVVDVSDERLEIATRMGADLTINSTTLGEEQTLAEIIGAPLGGVIDFVNNSATFAQAFDSLDKAGTLISIGLFGGESSFPNVVLATKSITVKGNYLGNLRQLRELVELAKQGNIPQLPLTHSELTCDRVEQGMQDLEAGTIIGRLVLTD